MDMSAISAATLNSQYLFKISFFARDNAKTNVSYLTLFFLHSSSQSGNTMLILSTPSSTDKRHIYMLRQYISHKPSCDIQNH